MNTHLVRALVYASPLLLLAACGDDGATDGGGKTDMAAAPIDMAQAPADMTGVDLSMADLAQPVCPPPAFVDNTASCKALASDYTPRVNMSKDDTWPACVSDNGTYQLIGMSTPSAAARTVAYDAIAARLWENAAVPGMMDFLKSRDDYSIANGIGSRVDRRQDLHYPEVPGMDKFACQQMGVPAMFPDRCFGPARLSPLITDAFQKGLTGEKPRVQAARIEAALMWFFYLSDISEIWTCSFSGTGDCDSCWGYFNGAKQRADAPVGAVGRYIKKLSPETYDRAFDAVLAARCWRDLDKALPAMDTAKMDLAWKQLDRAMLRGIALIARDRIAQLPCLKDAELEAAFEFVKLTLGWLDRESRARDVAKADVLKAAASAASGDKVDVKAAQAAIDGLYDCP